MAFKDELRKLIQQSGSDNPEDLPSMVTRLREVAPDITPQYLSRLLAGHPPRDIDRQAVTHALEPDCDKWLSQFWPLEDVERRRIARIAFLRRFKSHVLARKFVDHLDSVASFRTMDLTEGEILRHLNAFQPRSELEDEIDLFGLGTEDA